MTDENEMLEHLRSGPEDAGSEASAARRDLADALRELCHAVGACAVEPERIRAVAATLRAQNRTLAAASAAPSRSVAEALVPGMADFLDRSPIAGLANPLAPPASLRIDREASIVSGEVTFGPAFEGAPGIAHGGFVAAVLDEALGMASALSGRVCMTAELTTRYRHHTPIATPLRIEARLDSVDGRKVRTSGAVHAGDSRLVEATGVFIAVDAGKFQELVAARAERGDD